MGATSFPARLGYAIAALIIVGMTAFYDCMEWLPRYAANHPEFNAGVDGYGIFKVAIAAGAAVGGALFLLLLTMPGVRHRKRRGRPARIAVACGTVVGLSLLFAEEGFRLRYDLIFVVWLTYLLAFTFVRYGVMDEVRRSSESAKEYRSSI